MKMNSRLSDKEYDELSLEYEQNPPKLSGKPGFITNMREKILVTELLPPDYARIVNYESKGFVVVAIGDYPVCNQSAASRKIIINYRTCIVMVDSLVATALHGGHATRRIYTCGGSYGY